MNDAIKIVGVAVVAIFIAILLANLVIRAYIIKAQHQQCTSAYPSSVPDGFMASSWAEPAKNQGSMIMCCRKAYDSIVGEDVVVIKQCKLTEKPN
jgi:hypothetical protein